jgi:hypothetical protein
MVTARIQTHTVVIIPAILFGLGVLVSAGMTTTADGQPVDQEKVNRQLEQGLKALDSGDIAAVMEYLKETIQGLPAGVAKTHIEIALNALQYSNDTESARLHLQLGQGILQNSTSTG